MQPKVLIHVGMPKCASTTLQKHVFCNLESVQNFGLYPTKNIAGSNKIGAYKSCLFLEDKRLNAFYKRLHNDPSVTIEDLRNDWNSICSSLYDDTFESILLSHEALTSFFFSNLSQEDKADRLKKIFPEAKILLIVRDQIDWLRSQYNDHPFYPGNLSSGEPVGFNDWVNAFLTEKKLEQARDGLLYSMVVKLYFDRYPDDAVTVLRLEDLANNPQRFVSGLSNFLGVGSEAVNALLIDRHENESLSDFYNTIRKLRRKYSNFAPLNLFADFILGMEIFKKLPSTKHRLTARNLERLEEFYSDDNLRLERMIEQGNASSLELPDA